MSGPAAAAAGLRDTTEEDLPDIRDIYAHHVLHSLATFEEEVPSLDEMARRFADTKTEGLPYLVADTAEGVAGFAYARLYHPRPGYRFSVENSIYIRPGLERRGLGRRLLTALIEGCAALGYRQMIAVVGVGKDQASIGLHRALGFREVGTLRSVGCKFGRWVDTVTLQRPLGEGDKSLPPSQPIQA